MKTNTTPDALQKLHIRERIAEMPMNELEQFVKQTKFDLESKTEMFILMTAEKALQWHRARRKTLPEFLDIPKKATQGAK